MKTVVMPSTKALTMHPSSIRPAAMALSALGAAMIVASAGAHAADPIDKSRYSVFNPTPDSALRDFAADRPAKSFGPGTIDAGRLQAELEIVNYGVTNANGVTTRLLVGPNPTLRLGVTSNIELQAQFAPWQRVTQKTDGIVGDDSQTGPSDLFLRSKINLWGNEGGPSALAIMPYVKVPTAPTTLLGNGRTEGGFIVAATRDLGNSITLTTNSEGDWLKNAADTGYHGQYQGTLGLSGPIAKDLTLTAELWTSVNWDPTGTVRQSSFDVALARMVSKNVQLDLGANFGLTKDTPAVQVYTGITRRF